MGATAAILLTTTISSHAVLTPAQLLAKQVTAGNVEILAQLKLVNPALTIATASITQLRNATSAALTTPLNGSPYITFNIVAAATAQTRLRVYSGEIAGAAMTQIYTSSFSDATRIAQADLIIARAMTSAYTMASSTSDASDIAAQVVRASVNATSGLAAPLNAALLNPLEVVVRGAVRIAASKGGVGATNGAGGVVILDQQDDPVG